MKNVVIVFLCIFLFSCKTDKTVLSPFVAVYKSERIGNIYPGYIFLRTQPQVFEIYAPGIYSSTFGGWNINNDTLFVFPRYEYYSKDANLNLIMVSPADSSVTTIPQKYLIKQDNLIDITDYSTVLPKLFSQNNKIIYKRIK